MWFVHVVRAGGVCMHPMYAHAPWQAYAARGKHVHPEASMCTCWEDLCADLHRIDGVVIAHSLCVRGRVTRVLPRLRKAPAQGRVGVAMGSWEWMAKLGSVRGVMAQ